MNISLPILIFLILSGLCILSIGVCGFTGNLISCSVSVVLGLIIIISSVVYYFTQIRNKNNKENNNNNNIKN